MSTLHWEGWIVTLKFLLLNFLLVLLRSVPSEFSKISAYWKYRAFDGIDQSLISIVQ